MRIGIDIDGVLYPWAEAANAAVMAKFGVPDPGPHVRWNHLKDQITGEQWAWLWSSEGQHVAFSQYAITYPGAVDMVNAILRNPEHRVHFVTHRDPRRTAFHTAFFLGCHFNDHPWAGVHVLQNAIPKHGLMEWDVFIDDKPKTVREMLAHTEAQVFAPVRPLNEELAGHVTPRLIRYEHPREVSAWINAQADDGYPDTFA